RVMEGFDRSALIRKYGTGGQRHSEMRAASFPEIFSEANRLNIPRGMNTVELVVTRKPQTQAIRDRRAFILVTDLGLVRVSALEGEKIIEGGESLVRVEKTGPSLKEAEMRNQLMRRLKRDNEEYTMCCTE